ncbi:hypothetical protein, partial [Geobacillus thermoleovorans]|uniref:hypothetical protein n=1 Tax=Geobacillus thermoleovorans TaxID=33941 RepID=UPI003D24A672
QPSRIQDNMINICFGGKIVKVSLGLLIFWCLLSGLILYVIIETAVRRAIDSSRLTEKIDKILNEKNKRD